MAHDETAPTSLESLPSQDEEGSWLAVIEASQGTRHKLKYEARWKAFVLSGVLPLGLSFPYDFGFLPSTLGDDGDPLDVLVLADETLPPGAVAPCRLVGVIEALQRDKGRSRAERNDRLIAVAAKSNRYGECRELADIATVALDEIEQFFVSYNRHRGGSFKVVARRGTAAALRLVEQGQRRYRARAEQSSEQSRER